MPMKENISSKSKVGQRKIVNDMQSLIYSLHFLEKKKSWNPPSNWGSLENCLDESESASHKSVKSELSMIKLGEEKKT